MNTGSPRRIRKSIPFPAGGERVQRFAARLERESGRSLIVRVHRNRWDYFSCRAMPGGHKVVVRIHEAFLEAPPKVLRAVTTLIRRNDKRAQCVIQRYVTEQSPIWDKRAARPPRPLRIVPRGKVYDLRALFNDLNRRYFDGRCLARITWGNGARSARGQRQITFGTFDKTGNVIRIHPALDNRRVPEYFVRYIAFHEMLHATTPPSLSPSGRRLYHSRLFRQRERQFEDFQKAQTWGKRFVEEVM